MQIILNHRKKVNFDKVNYLMSIASDMAYEAEKMGEVPVGAVLTNGHGDILAKTFNTKEQTPNACFHAEVLAISEASKKLNSWRLLDCDLYVTLEPCPMCMAAISQARIQNVFFGAYDPKGGAISLGLNLHKDQRLNHKVQVYGGFQHHKNSRLLSNFFKQKRRRYKA